MKYVNYLFLFVAFSFSTSLFAQPPQVEQEEQAQQTEVPPFPLGSEEEYEYNGENLVFHFQAEEQGVLVIALDVDGLREGEALEMAIQFRDLYDQKIAIMGRGSRRAPQGIFIVRSAGEYMITIQQFLMVNPMPPDVTTELPDVDSLFGLEPENVPSDVEVTRTIRVVSSFLPTSSFASFGTFEDKDGDRSPINASLLLEDTEERAVVGGAEDPWDWWKMRCKFLRLTASTEIGDIILEHNNAGNGWVRIDNHFRTPSIQGDLEEMQYLKLDTEFITVRVSPLSEEEVVHYSIRIDPGTCLNLSK